MNIVEKNINAVSELCKKHRVRNLYLFGSALTDIFSDKSDVDLLVDFKKLPLKDYSDNYFDLKFSLEDLFSRQVDLLEEKALKTPFLIRSINRYKKMIYGRKDRKMVV